jgi:hypothetical protein
MPHIDTHKTPPHIRLVTDEAEDPRARRLRAWEERERAARHKRHMDELRSDRIATAFVVAVVALCIVFVATAPIWSR